LGPREDGLVVKKGKFSLEKGVGVETNCPAGNIIICGQQHRDESLSLGCSGTLNDRRGARERKPENPNTYKTIIQPDHNRTPEPNDETTQSQKNVPNRIPS
jgi:hypothetical protein